MGVFRKKSGFAIAAILLLALLLFPFETTVVPEWNLRIVDETGRPVRGMPVRESWSYSTLQNEGEQDQQLTNDEGYVRFPRRGIRAGVLTRTIKFLINAVNVHGGRGPAAWVFVMGDYKPVGDEPYYVPGRPLATQIVVRRPGPP